MVSILQSLVSAEDTLQEKRLSLSQRQEKLLHLLRSRHFIDINHLTAELNVSLATIRRDLAELEGQGQIMRTHGGAVALNQVSQDYEASVRETMNLEEKKQIARAAARLIIDGDTVMIDSGTTSKQVAILLSENPSLTFVTTGIDVLATLIAQKDVKVHAIGGEYIPINRSVGGAMAMEMVRQFNVDKVILSISSIDLKRGQICTLHPQIGCVQQAMIESAHSVIVVADYSKFSRAALSVITSLKHVDHIVTDKKAYPKISGLPDALKRKFIIAED